MGTTIKETLAISAKYDGGEVTTGLKSVNSSLGDIAKTATGMIGAFAGWSAITATIRGVESALSAVKDTYLNIIDVSGRFQDIQFKTDMILRNVGSTYDEQRHRLKELSDEMWNYAGVNEETITKIFEKMLTFSGDIEQSFSAIPAVLDLTSTGLVNIEMATRGISQTLEGQVGVLGRYVPALTKLTKEEMKAGGAIDLILGKYKGLAHAHTITLPGSIETFKEAIVALGIALGGDSTESLAGMISSLANEIHEFASSDDAKEMSSLLGNIAENINQVLAGLIGGGGGNDFASLMKNALKSLEAYTGTQLIGDLQNLAIVLKDLYLTLKGLMLLLYPAKGWGMIGVQISKEFEAARREEEYRARQSGKAGGGLIFGGGNYISSGNDSMMIPVQPGEFVMNSHATARLLPLLKKLNDMYGSTMGGGYSAGGYTFGDWYRWHDTLGGNFGSAKDDPEALEKFMKHLEQMYGFRPGGIGARAASYVYAMNLVKSGNYGWMYLQGIQEMERVSQFPQMLVASSDRLERSMWKEIASFAKHRMSRDEAESAVMGFYAEALASTPPRRQPLTRMHKSPTEIEYSLRYDEELTTQELIDLDKYRIDTVPVPTNINAGTSSDMRARQKKTFSSTTTKTPRTGTVLWNMIKKYGQWEYGLDTRMAQWLTEHNAQDIGTMSPDMMHMFQSFGGQWRFPAFAEGGTVPGMPGQPQLIVAHGGEEVLPRDAAGMFRQLVSEIRGALLRPSTSHAPQQAMAMGGSPVVLIATDDSQKAEIVKNWLKNGANVDLESMSAHQAYRREYE